MFRDKIIIHLILILSIIKIKFKNGINKSINDNYRNKILIYITVFGLFNLLNIIFFINFFYNIFSTKQIK